MPFQRYRKTTFTWARVLDAQDYQDRGGMIETAEGPFSFQVGDYLAMDIKGVWPIPREQIEQGYRKHTRASSNNPGWAYYEPLAIREARQMTEPFIINGLTGKAGDYLVREGDNSWPVDREIFERSYTLVEEGEGED